MLLVIIKIKGDRFIKILLYNIIFLFICFQTFGQKKLFSCIDENGKVLFNFETNYVWSYSEGLALFKTYSIKGDNKKWSAGFINESGNIELPAIYDSKDVSKYGFKNGVSWVKVYGEKNYSLINNSGQIILKNKYEDVGYFKDSICAVFNNNKMGFINSYGEEIIPCEYNGSIEFYENLIFVSKVDDNNNKYGFLDKSGYTSIPFIFEKIDNCKFVNGECLVKKEGKYQIINKNGIELYSFESQIKNEYFSNEKIISCVENDNKKTYGLIDKNNKWIIPPIYEDISCFENNQAIVFQNNRYGIIDTIGNIILPINFDEITKVCKKGILYLCRDKNTKTFYNYKGEKLSNENTQHIKSKEDGNFYPYRDIYNKWGYLNINGYIHIPAQYDFVEPFSEGKAWIY